MYGTMYHVFEWVRECVCVCVCVCSLNYKKVYIKLSYISLFYIFQRELELSPQHFIRNNHLSIWTMATKTFNYWPYKNIYLYNNMSVYAHKCIWSIISIQFIEPKLGTFASLTIYVDFFQKTQLYSKIILKLNLFSKHDLCKSILTIHSPNSNSKGLLFNNSKIWNKNSL